MKQEEETKVKDVIKYLKESAVCRSEGETVRRQLNTITFWTKMFHDNF
jgi:hypothetical protein